MHCSIIMHLGKVVHFDVKNPNMEEKHLWFFSKSAYTRSVIKQARKDHATLLTIDDLFD